MTIAPAPGASLARKLPLFVLGVSSVGFGVALTIRAEVGVAPYDVLTTGLASATGLPIGVAAVAVPVMFTVLGTLFGGRPGPGTLAAVVTVGPIIALGIHVLPEVEALAARAPMFGGGCLLLAIGLTAVVVADLGPGPAELLMLAIHDKGPGLAVVRTGIELVCIGAGWAMGGQVGAGTIAIALLIGPTLRRTLDIAGYRGPRVDAAEPGGAGP